MRTQHECNRSFFSMLLQRTGMHGPLLESPRFRRGPKRSTVLCTMIATCMALMLVATVVILQATSLHSSMHVQHASSFDVRRDVSTDSVLRAIQHASYAASRRVLMEHGQDKDRVPANPHDQEPPTPPQDPPSDGSSSSGGDDDDRHKMRERRKAERKWKRGGNEGDGDCHSKGNCAPPSDHGSSPPDTPPEHEGGSHDNSESHDDPNAHGDHASDGRPPPPTQDNHDLDHNDGSGGDGDRHDHGSEDSGPKHAHSGDDHSHDDSSNDPRTHEDHANPPPPPTHDNPNSGSDDDTHHGSEDPNSEHSEPSADSVSSMGDGDDDSYYFMHGEEASESSEGPEHQDEGGSSDSKKEQGGSENKQEGSEAKTKTHSGGEENWDSEASISVGHGNDKDTEAPSTSAANDDDTGDGEDTGAASEDPEDPFEGLRPKDKKNTGEEGVQDKGTGSSDSPEGSTDTEGTDTEGSSNTQGPIGTEENSTSSGGNANGSNSDDGSGNTKFAAGTASGSSSSACPSEGKWDIGQWNVDEAIGKAWLFFEAQKSGKLPSDHRVKWRGDSYLKDEHKGRDLSGGWFDAGDHLKLVFPMAWSVANMAWAMRDGRRLLTHTRFDGKSNWEWGMRTLEHGVKFLLDCTFEDGEFVAQIGIAKFDHADTLRAELDDVTPRSVFTTHAPERPGSDMLMQAAAALASSSHVLRATSGSHQLAHRALSTAKDLFAEALKSPGLYSDSIPADRLNYPSHNWEQYAFWAAAWLFSVTGEQGYRVVRVFLGYEDPLHKFARSHLDASNGVRHTPKGLTFLNEWGALRHAAGVAGIISAFGRGLLVKGHPDAKAMMDFAERQMTYILGASGHSWIVGFGCNPPMRAHHRDAALTLAESGNKDLFYGTRSNANVITGALVGGPDVNGNWKDDRNNYRQNEVALDYNAALLLGLIQVKRLEGALRAKVT